MKYMIFILTIIFLSGCSYKSYYRTTEVNEIIQDKWVAITISDNSWKIFKDYAKSKYHNTERGLPNLFKNLRGTRYKVDFRTYHYKESVFTKQFFNKDSVYDDSDKVKEVYDEIDREQGINYKKGWQVYIKGMRCAGGVYARVSKGIYSHVDKNYGITCGYYDRKEGKRLLDIGYNYIYANSNTRLQKDSNLKRKELLTKEQVENGLKQAVKELINTIKIKNLDIKRMEKEGLMHYDREFESTKW